MVTEALRRASDTKALEFGVGAIEKTGKMFRELFPSSRAVVVAETPGKLLESVSSEILNQRELSRRLLLS